MSAARWLRGTRAGVVAVAAAALVVPMMGTAQAAPGGNPGAPDTRPVGSNYNNGKPLPLSGEKVAGNHGKDSDSYKVGTTRRWPALDDAKGTVYNKNFVLRGIGDNVEVWVAKDTAFPAGDCRNSVGGGEGIVITDQQVASFIEEFDSNIYPKESVAFSVPPFRDGSITPLTRAYAQFYGLSARNYKGEGDRIVTLIDNVRDSNYYTPTAADGKTYIGGFHYSLFNEYTNRNVMTLDSWDWVHRTGTNPPDDSAQADYVACSEYLGRPFGDPRTRQYEGTMAHEYQHLLEYYASPGEANWINEGLADWSQTLVGYVNPKLDPQDPEADSHLEAWMGFSDDPAFGGPEQSLTRWQDQGAPEILADYGIAYAFMEYLHSHFQGDGADSDSVKTGDEFMSRLHNEDKNGVAGLDATLDAFGYSIAPKQVITDFLASMAVDQQLEGSKSLVQGDEAVLSTESMSARINWDTAQAYSTPGAPTNGADYVQIPGADGSLEFTGQQNYPAQPVEWQQQGARLYSGAGDDLDRAIARQVAIPADEANATVTVNMEYQTEALWDYAFVQVFDEATGSWVSLANENTTTESDPAAAPAVQANLPGFTGSSGGPTAQTFDLSDYAGQSVWIAVRYITDGAVVEPGVWVDGLSVGGVAQPGANDLTTWKSPTQAIPTPVDWVVQLVGWNDTQVSTATVPLTGGSASVDVSEALGITPTFAGAIVTVADMSETVQQYAPYTLKDDGTTLAGGS